MKRRLILILGAALALAAANEGCSEALKKCAKGKVRVFCAVDVYTSPAGQIPTCADHKVISGTFCVKDIGMGKGAVMLEAYGILNTLIAKLWNTTFNEFITTGGVFAQPHVVGTIYPCLISDTNPVADAIQVDLENAGPPPGTLPQGEERALEASVTRPGARSPCDDCASAAGLGQCAGALSVCSANEMCAACLGCLASGGAAAACGCSGPQASQLASCLLGACPVCSGTSGGDADGGAGALPECRAPSTTSSGGGACGADGDICGLEGEAPCCAGLHCALNGCELDAP